MSDASALLPAALAVAVPLRVAELAGVPFAERARLGRDAGAVVTAHGDDVLFRSARPGGTARAFAAMLAYQPGGVRFAGLHFEAGSAVGVGGASPPASGRPRDSGKGWA